MMYTLTRCLLSLLRRIIILLYFTILLKEIKNVNREIFNVASIWSLEPNFRYFARSDRTTCACVQYNAGITFSSSII